MTDGSTRQSVQGLLEFAMTFQQPGGGGQVDLVKGILGPAPHAACSNVLRVDPRTGEFAEPEVVAAESGTLTDLFRRIETVLSERHPGCQKVITFEYTRGW